MNINEMIQKANENREAILQKMKENAANNPKMDVNLKEAIQKLG